MDIEEIKKRHLTCSCCKKYRPETVDGTFGYCEQHKSHDHWCAALACELIDLKPTEEYSYV